MHDFLDVLAFHKRFDLPCSEFTEVPPPDVLKFRLGFMHEEINEYHQAYGQGNLVAVVDALLDFVYVAIGTAFFIGTPRNGPVANWPTFRTARQILVNQGILDEMHVPPHFLAESMHVYTCLAIRQRVNSFNHAYQAALEIADGAAPLMIMTLKEATDEAYKAASMMHIPWDCCWRHVQEANMKKRRAKSDGSDSKRSSSYDVIKPTGWVAPDSKIATELMLEGWRIPDSMNIDNLTGKVKMKFSTIGYGRDQEPA